MYSGYVFAIPCDGSGGVFHDMVFGVLSDPVLVLWEFLISHLVVHNCVPDGSYVFVSLFVEWFVLIFGRSIIDGFDVCFFERGVECAFEACKV